MRKWIFGFFAVALGGALFAYLVPRLAAVGIVIAAVSSVVVLQAVLIAIASALVKRRDPAPSEPLAELPPSAFARLLWAYQDLKWFLGRLTGIVGLVYGVITHSLYFILLGAAATLLFWVLDRMHDSWFEDLQGRIETPLGPHDAESDEQTSI